MTLRTCAVLVLASFVFSIAASAQEADCEYITQFERSRLGFKKMDDHGTFHEVSPEESQLAQANVDTSRIYSEDTKKLISYKSKGFVTVVASQKDLQQKRWTYVELLHGECRISRVRVESLTGGKDITVTPDMCDDAVLNVLKNPTIKGVCKDYAKLWVQKSSATHSAPAKEEWDDYGEHSVTTPN